MIHNRLTLTLAFSSLSLAAACGVALPEGLDCRDVRSGGDDGVSLKAALADSRAGDCVALGDHTFKGAFRVPAGVTLVAENGARPRLVGTRADAPAVLLVGGDGTRLLGVRVGSAAGIGVGVLGAPALLDDVTITDAASAGVAVACGADGCAENDARVVIIDSQLDENWVGLWIQGIAVDVQRGSVSRNRSTQLLGGQGVVASGGARLSLLGTTVAENDYGILVDGNSTTADGEDLVVDGNRERGIWAQHLRGTLEAPALRLHGGGTVIRRNGLAGVGLIDSLGIIIIDGRVEDTVAKPVLTGLGPEELVGDGVGLFGQSGAARLERVTLANNARSQLLVDNGSSGITVVDGAVSEGTGQYKVVVQNTYAGNVTIPLALLSTGVPELGIDAPTFAVEELVFD